MRITVRDSVDQTNTEGVILYQSHTDSQFQAGQGFSISAGDNTFTLPNGAKLSDTRFVYIVVEQAAGSSGTLNILGSTLDIGGITQFYAYLEQEYVLEELKTIVDTDIYTPRYVNSDTTVKDLETIAADTTGGLLQ